MHALNTSAEGKDLDFRFQSSSSSSSATSTTAKKKKKNIAASS